MNTHTNLVCIYNILTTEDSWLLICDNEDVHGSSLKINALYFFKTSGTLHPIAQCHIQE